MRKVLIFLLILPFVFSAKSQTVEESVALSSSSFVEAVSTVLSFTHTLTVSTSPEYVLSGDPSDLNDGDKVCLNAPLEVHVELSSKFAKGGVWHFEWVDPDLRFKGSYLTTPSEANFQVYDSEVYEDYYWYGDVSGEPIDPSWGDYVVEPVVVIDQSTGDGYDRYDQAAKVYSILSPYVEISTPDGTQTFDSGKDFSLAYTPATVGTVTISDKFNVSGVLLIIRRDSEIPGETDSDTYFAAYSGYELYSKDVGTNVLTLSVENPNPSMEVVSSSPSTISSFPVDVSITVRNNGNVALKATSVSVDEPSISATPVSGFNTLISPGDTAVLVVELSSASSPPPSFSLNIVFESEGEVCGDVQMANATVSFGLGLTSDLTPEIEAPDFAYVGDSFNVSYIVFNPSTNTISGSSNRTASSSVRGVLHSTLNSNFSSYPGRNVLEEITLSCTSPNETIVVRHEIYSPSDSDTSNNAVEKTILCEEVLSLMCTVSPDSVVLLPDSSATLTVSCFYGSDSVYCPIENVTFFPPDVPLSYIVIGDNLVLNSSYFEDDINSIGTVDVVSTIDDSTKASATCRFNVFLHRPECVDYI